MPEEEDDDDDDGNENETLGFGTATRCVCLCVCVCVALCCRRGTGRTINYDNDSELLTAGKRITLMRWWKSNKAETMSEKVHC